MIRYALRCGTGHGFESWFASSAAFDELARDGHVTCPVCDDTHVEKAPMAPRIGTSSPEPLPSTPELPALAGPPVAEAAAMIAAFCRSVETHCDYVGGGFPEEARKIHYGETDPRPIYGEASSQQARELKEEGVEIAAIPWVRKPDA